MKNNILRILKDIKPEIEINLNSKLFESGYFDSFDLVLIVGELENFFKLNIPGEMIIPENFEDIKSIESMIQKLQN